MPQVMFGKSDSVVPQISDALTRYEQDHPGSRGSLYRHNSVSVRIRVVDPSFRGLSKVEREEHVWPYLNAVSDEAMSELTLLLLLAPEETGSSLANLDFDHPLPSTL